MSKLDKPLVLKPDSSPQACWGCGAESTTHVRARCSTPLGQTFIRVCPTKECAAAGAQALRETFAAGDVIRVLELTRPE